MHAYESPQLRMSAREPFPPRVLKLSRPQVRAHSSFVSHTCERIAISSLVHAHLALAPFALQSSELAELGMRVPRPENGGVGRVAPEIGRLNTCSSRTRESACRCDRQSARTYARPRERACASWHELVRVRTCVSARKC
eukprot:1703856-Pleurochrysis_carterae.AAC.2